MSTLLEQASLVMIPSGYKEDIVYSQIPTNGNGDLSFTRASNGTRINSAGLVEVVAWNLAQYSEDFSNGVWSISGVTVAANTTTAPNGTNTADTATIGTAGGHFLLQAISVIPLQQYTFSFYVKRGTATALSYSVWNNTAGGNIVAPTNYYSQTSSEWTRISIDFTVPSGCNVIAIYPLRDGASTGTVYLWGAQLNIGSTAKPYFPTTDRLNVPRLTYQNGGGGCPSLLLEKQSTNYLKWSNDFTQSAWSASASITRTANYATSPDGTQTATRIQWNGTDGELYQYLGQSSPTRSSVYVKGTAGQVINFCLTLVTLTGEWQRIDAASIIDVSDTWFGVIAKSSVGHTATDFLLWGGQGEAGTYATSLIPTTSSSATRVADACFKTGISSLIGQTEGVLFVDFVCNGIKDLYTNIINSEKNVTNSFYVHFGLDGYIRAGVFANSVQRELSTGGFVVGQRYKLAFAYKSGDLALYSNGIQKATSALTFAFNSSLDDIYLNDTTTYFGYQENFNINQVILFPTRLTNAELASLTTI